MKLPRTMGVILLLAACGDDGGMADPFDPTDGGSGTTGEPPATCQVDGQRNGSETDVDCGGPQCPACDNGDDCLLNADCVSNSCQSDTCSSPNCNDGGQNGDETDIDCGGSCAADCGAGLGCNEAADCQSGICEAGACVAPSCRDGIENGSETALDCGGPSCDPCPDGSSCGQNADCVSGYCNSSTCEPKSCRSDDDCTELDGPCAMGQCSASDFQCYPTAINERLACDDGDPCTLDTVCGNARCAGGTPPDCTRFDDTCTVGVCNQDDGSCEPAPTNEGGACDDGDPCTAGDVCTAGACADPDGPDVHLDEDFADRTGGWTLGTDWEIGPATASPVGEVGGSDPDLDHTPTADNGVAGVLIGGLISGSGPAKYLESPVLTLAAAPGDLQLRLWRWLNADVNSSTQQLIEVFDGATWVVLYENAEVVTADGAWVEMTFDITPYKNDQFQVRIGHDGAGNAPAVGGWNVDDVRIAPPTCP